MKIAPAALLALHGAAADTPAPDQAKDAALGANGMLRGTPDPQAAIMSHAKELVPAGDKDSSFLRSQWWNDDTAISSSSCDGHLGHFLRPPDNCPWYCGTACLHYALGTGAICDLYCNDMSRDYDLYGGEFCFASAQRELRVC